MDVKATKGLIAIKNDIDCDPTAMGLPPVASAVFLIAKYFLLKRGSLRGISEMPLLTPSGIKRGRYV
jgi:hypothetical protein